MPSQSVRLPIVIFAVSILTTGLYIRQTQAHGTIRLPLSRVYSCYLEGPEAPKSDACKAAVATSGTQQLYDWNGVGRQDANGQHRQIIQDGQLCSAGLASHRGLDLPRNDWPAQQLIPDASGNFEFIFRATAPHATDYFNFYITRPEYDPTQPLQWSDLENEPFCHHGEIALTDGQYRMSCPIPADRRGKALIYNIWQRSDSPEAFYSCIDVEILDSENPGETPTTSTPVATNTPTATPATPSTTPAATQMPTQEATQVATQTPTQTADNTPTPSATPATSTEGCSVDYEITSDWGSGFNAGLVVTNHEPTMVSGWTLSWSFDDAQSINSLWEGEVTQTGAAVTVQNAAWNGTIAPDGGIVSLGFSASGDGSAVPDEFSLNGTNCNLSQREFAEASPTAAVTAPAETATPTATPSGGQPTTTLPDPTNPEAPSGIAVYLPLFVP